MLTLGSKLLSLLKDHRIYSSQELSVSLQCDATHLAQTIHQLQTFGLPILSKKIAQLEHYWLNPSWQPLSRTEMIKNLKQISEQIKIVTSFSTTSTMDDVNKINLSSTNEIIVAVSEHQSQGRGRNHKAWISPFGSNLSFSAKYNLHIPKTQHLTALSPLIGIRITKILHHLGVSQAKVKWPNDIWAGHKKLAGILINLEKIQKQTYQMTIGIGINVLNPKYLNPSYASENASILSTDCQSISNLIIDRNLLAAQLIDTLFQFRDSFAKEEIESLTNLWPNYSCLYQQPIRLYSKNKEHIGKEAGIREDGALLIQNEQSISAHVIGELSLRPLLHPK